MREHKFLKKKFRLCNLKLKKEQKYEDNFNQEIDELNQETESLVSEIEKWQT